MNPRFLGCLALLFSGCIRSNQTAGTAPVPVRAAAARAPRVLRLLLFDVARQRSIPVAVYLPDSSWRGKPKAALLSHGYGGHHTDYSFIARHLAAHGYLVASVQHELPTDAPLPATGNPREVRRPNWERGVQNLLFVSRALQRQHPGVDFKRVLLVGHSNGGDVAMLFAAQHPRQVQRIISLDNRRMPLPRARRPQVLSLRSSDQVADDGVLPTPAEQQRYGIRVVKLPATIHNDMWDGATKAQQLEIMEHISRFLVKSK